jgi:hypothetical protein
LRRGVDGQLAPLPSPSPLAVVEQLHDRLGFTYREDATVPFARSDSVRRSFPRAEFHVVDSAGHIRSTNGRRP